MGAEYLKLGSAISTLLSLYKGSDTGTFTV